MRNIANQADSITSRTLIHPLSCVSILILLLTTSLPMVGCSILGSRAKANETRILTAPAVPGQSLRVNTVNGRVIIAVDKTRQDVNIEANITTTGSTTEEASDRLKTVAVIVNQAEGNVLDISVDYGPEGRKSSDACSFNITLPAVSGIFVQSSNGSIKLTDTTGAADLHTSNGSVTLTRHDGSAVIKTSNGSLKLEGITGDMDARTSNGSITYTATPNNNNLFSLHTSNGSIHITIPQSMSGTINTSTSNGRVNISTIPENTTVTGDKKHRTIVLGSTGQPVSEARTSNGNITININP